MHFLASALMLATAGASVSAPVLTEIEAPGPQGPLKGTVTKGSSKNDPVVLILPGSGPTDRDGNSPLGVKAQPYKLLAEGLAAEGVTSVRIDKRGMFGSTAATDDANAVTMKDYAADTRSWIDAIRKNTGASCVWLLGHSEGGLVALTTASSHNDSICGLILVATPGRPLGEVMKEQLRANPANAVLLDAADRTIDTLSAGERVDTDALPLPLKGLFRPEVQGFLISLFAVDPAKLIAASDRPVLILQGERDMQVSTADANRLESAKPDAVLKLLPDTNHVLKLVGSDSSSANMATYGNPDLPLAPGVTEVIAQFVKANGQ